MVNAVNQFSAIECHVARECHKCDEFVEWLFNTYSSSIEVTNGRIYAENLRREFDIHEATIHWNWNSTSVLEFSIQDKGKICKNR